MIDIHYQPHEWIPDFWLPRIASWDARSPINASHLLFQHGFFRPLWWLKPGRQFLPWWKLTWFNGKTSSLMGIHRHSWLFFYCQVIFRGGCTTNEKITTVTFHFSNPAEGSGSPCNLFGCHALNPHSWSFFIVKSLNDVTCYFQAGHDSFLPKKKSKITDSYKKLYWTNTIKKVQSPWTAIIPFTNKIMIREESPKNDPNSVPNHPFSPPIHSSLRPISFKYWFVAVLIQKKWPKTTNFNAQHMVSPRTFKCCSMGVGSVESHPSGNETKLWELIWKFQYGLKSNDTYNPPKTNMRVKKFDAQSIVRYLVFVG